MDAVQAAGESRAIAVKGASTEPRGSGPPVPRDHPVVQGEPERRQVLVRRRDRRQAFQGATQVIAEEPCQTAEEPWRVGGRDGCRIQPADQAPGHRERVGSGRR